MSDSQKKLKDSSKEVLRIARERFQLAVDAESNIRELALDDLKFRAGDQWDAEMKRQREIEKRPCITINRIPQFIRQITNDQRQNRPSIKVFPVDDKGDIETAKVFQGLIRHIEYNSHADAAYDTAFEGSVTGGFGYFRILTDFADPMSFEQEILIKRIRNPFSVYLDPNAKEPDGSDANWGFIFENVPEEDYKAEYGESTLANMKEWNSIGDQSQGWIADNTVRIAEYFYKEFKTVTIIQLSNFQVVEKSDDLMLPPEIQIIAERQATVPVIKWTKINGIEVLDEKDWAGKWIPIIPVYGDELDINGERVLEGVVRHAKDSAKMYNYWATTETETIALAPKAPWIVAEGQIPPEYKAQWQTANSKNHAFLTYKPTSLAGQPVGAPQRNVYEPAVSAITNARMQAADDLKATTGIYDSALGAQSREVSGVAIRGRQAQSQTSNFHFIDNLTRSLRHAGRILVDLIPKVYDTARAARIIGEEGEQEIIMLNELFEHKGKQVQFDLGIGKYDVAVETGPSYATKRQEALASMIDLTRAYPQIAQVASDLMVKNMDWPGASEIAERLKKTLPPGLADDPKQQQPLPPQIQSQMTQMNQMIEQLTAHLNEANDKLKTKTIELESRERIEFAKIEADIKKEMAKIQGQAAILTYKEELADISRRLDLLGINEPIEEDFNEVGPDQAGPQYEQPQQPTGGPSPGQFMEE
jgi:hypothetical protein